MPSTQTLLEVALAGFALSLSPGPSMMYVLSRTLGQSRAAGYASSLGLAIGGILLAAVSATGLAVLLKESTEIFVAVSLLGAGYLFYLAFNTVKSTLNTLSRGVRDEGISEFNRISIHSIVGQGVLVELLNPKTILFFVAFLPAFIDPNATDAWMQMCILGMLIPLTAIPSDLVIATAAGSMSNIVNRNPRACAALEILGAVILSCIAIRVVYVTLAW